MVRILVALAAAAAVAAMVASAAPARQPARAQAGAAVVTGTLGDVAAVRASGDDSTGRSASSDTPDGIALGGGSVSVVTSRGGGDASASAEAEATDVELLGGAVTASRVRRTAADGGDGVRYGGTVRGLKLAGKAVGTVVPGRRYAFTGGVAVASTGGVGLAVTLTTAVDGFPAGTRVVVAEVSASARDGVNPSPTPTATRAPTVTPTPTRTPTATPEKRRSAKPKAPAYKRRLLSRRFVFPVAGATRIGGPFGSFRADTGAHEGNDLFADFGTPVVAPADGTVENVGSLKISGNRLWVYADTGDRFFYAHLSAFAPEAVDHARVRAGEILGYVGNTGDAEPTPPHLHFEIHPDGGDAVDPHRFLGVWQRRAGALTADSGERPGALVEVRDFIGDG